MSELSLKESYLYDSFFLFVLLLQKEIFMQEIRNYKTTEANIWTGRIDDVNDVSSYRWHQIVNIIDLNSSNKKELKEDQKLSVCFIGFCCDKGVRRNLGREGAARGPESIRKELANLPVTNYNSLELFDAGDISCKDIELEEAQESLSEAISRILKYGYFPIVLGGGHEIAFGNYNGILKYLQEYSKKPSLGIINFDAHLDLRPYKDKGSSGTMFYQISEKCKTEKIRFNYLCIGTQTYSNTISLFNRAKELGASYINAKDIVESNYNDISSEIVEFVNKNEYIYLTICSDVFSSAFAPGVSAPQPFGLSPEIVVKFVKEIISSNKVISFDIAEVSPRFDHDNQTSKLAAVIIYAAINTYVEANKFL